MYTLDELSDRLFGRSLRLKVAGWVLTRDDPVFYQTQAALGVGYPPSGVVQELDRLVGLGMVVRHDPTPGDRRQYYTRVESPFWPIIQAALDALKDQEPARVSGR